MNNTTNRFFIVVVIVLTIMTTISLTLQFSSNGELGENANAASDSSGTIDRDAVEKIIAEYLDAHPEIILNSFYKARQKQEQKISANAAKTIKTKREELENDPKSPYVGKKDADVTIVKFSDYNCGYCKRVVPDLITLLKEDKNLKLVLKDMPILGPQSVLNSKAALVANSLDPSKWWKFHTSMMKSTPRNKDQILAIAKKVGFDTAKFEAEMNNPAIDAQLQKNLALGQSIGVSGTPAFVIGGKFIRGAVGLSVFRDEISKARAAAK